MRNIKITYSKGRWNDLKACVRKKIRQELETARGTVVCAACGAANATTYMYCHNCGHPLEK